MFDDANMYHKIFYNDRGKCIRMWLTFEFRIKKYYVYTGFSYSTHIKYSREYLSPWTVLIPAISWGGGGFTPQNPKISPPEKHPKTQKTKQNASF